ncbi:hypothetical protein RRG08_063202 [Elysia crispata]|uniref:Uncharacterized protein n=1 Tax=Elysia crispata TaxID=231223 RepID=A0AAE0YTZ5_9GAST|nr:hypothetical protein RRG08_063202 [Elysia crispata]
MPKAGFTGAHVDSVYMSRGSPDLMTLWTPLGDIDIEMGVLAVCEASHRLPEFDHFQATYGNMDAEKVGLKELCTCQQPTQHTLQELSVTQVIPPQYLIHSSTWSTEPCHLDCSKFDMTSKASRILKSGLWGQDYSSSNCPHSWSFSMTLLQLL